MRLLGAIVIGIGAYGYDRAQFPQLRYASSDADEIVQYLTTCWPKPDVVKVIHLAEGDATIEAVSDAFLELRLAGPFDLQLIFLSGHGLVSDANAGFVLQPSLGSLTPTLLDHHRLDELLASVSAKRTVLVLDCCYAEGITRRMEFFSGLGESDAKLFIASSREQQLTWEDERVGHGIFTAHLLDLLKTGSSVKLRGVRDQLDVDGELFPVLCDQVPLYVLEHKQQRQEPVKGGVAIRAVTLPVARAARRITERTAFGTALRRLRQILVGGVAACMVFLVLAYSLSYYAEADRDGDIRLKHGTRWLAPALRFLPALRADTGISSASLSDNPASRYEVQTGEAWGFWTQMSRQNYRAWYDVLRPSLDTVAVDRYDVLLASGTRPPAYQLNSQSRPSEIALAAWAVLDTQSTKDLDLVLTHVLGADQTSPLMTPFSPNEMDFDILDLTQSELGSFADALRYAAAVDPDHTFTAWLGFLKANQSWLAHSSPEQHGSEAQRRASDDVADVLAVITRARIDRGLPAVDQTMLSELNEIANLGYSELVHLALSRVVAPSPGAQALSRTRALAAFKGDSADPAQASALRQLKDSLDASFESKAIVEQVYKRFVAVGGPEQSDLTAFLIVAADKKALPTTILTVLIRKAQDAVARHDREFMDTEYARILGHAMSEVPLDSRSVVYQLIEVVAADVTPLSTSTAEIYTALTKQGLETPAMSRQIIATAKKAPPYQPRNPALVAEPLPGLSIVVGYEPWLYALAVLGGHRPLAADSISVLERHSIDPTVHDDIIRALSRQSAYLNNSCWNTNCSRFLAAFANDSLKRQLSSDILAEKLATVPRDQFLRALDELRKERLSDTEPEIRIALGLSMINAQLTRVLTNLDTRQIF